MYSYDKTWTDTMKAYNMTNAENQKNISNLNHLENNFDAHRNYYPENKDTLLLKATGAINKVVDKNLYGIIEQGVNIGSPEFLHGGSRKQNYNMNPLVGTDSSTYLPSNNAVKELVSGLSMGGAKPKPNKDLTNARKAMDKFLSGERKTKPSMKHLQILHEHGELELDGGNIFKSISKTVKSVGKDVSKTAKKVGKESSKTMKKVDKGVVKYVLPVAKQGATLGLDIVDKASGSLGALAGTAAATSIGQPELIPVFGALGSATASELSKRGRAEVKKQTGLGKPKTSPWIEHVKKHAMKHGVNYKQAMTDAKATYKSKK
jgi:hypothetical protein